MASKRFPIGELIKTLKKTFEEKPPFITRLSRKRKRDPFIILMGTLLSLRTKDELTEKVIDRLVSYAKTPEEILSMPEEKLKELIYPVGFYKNKAATLKHVSKEILERYQGKVPESLDELLAIKGIGRKTANLVITEAFKKPGICVDTHVHRISNRMGLVSTKHPDKTEEKLREILPKKYWTIYNTLLVTFGKTICKPISPLCSECPVSYLCKKVGVTKTR
ncbi:MAG: endonuclease III [Syntrophorhabdaceae bacterium]|nr:endonuclease III [Syntrophorhabdaceae bacterium]